MKLSRQKVIQHPRTSGLVVSREAALRITIALGQVGTALLLAASSCHATNRAGCNAEATGAAGASSTVVTDRLEKRLDQPPSSVILSIQPALEPMASDDRSTDCRSAPASASTRTSAAGHQPVYFNRGSAPGGSPDTSNSLSRRHLLASSVAPPSGRVGLSPETTILARKWNLIDDVEHLDQLKAVAPGSRTQTHMITLLTVKQKINEDLLAAMFDSRKSLTAIDMQLAHTQELRAAIVDRRDRAIRYNAYGGLVAGGITGMLSGAFRLGNLTELASGSIDVVEGATQSVLSVWALKNARTEHKTIQGISDVLTTIIFSDRKETPDFPPTVWAYLNSVPAGSKTGSTRRQDMVRRWTSKKFCLIHQGRPVLKVPIKSGGEPKITIDVLEDRIAMLQDLRSVVAAMCEPLGEIARHTRGF